MMALVCGGAPEFQKSRDLVHELGYAESDWCIQPRCKVCPDAIGESADIAAADFWPGGAPAGEDAGFNSIIVRSRAGQAVVESAVENGNLAITRDLDIRDMDDTQPHQVRKKEELWARFAGIRAAGHPVPSVDGLRLRELAATKTFSENLAAAPGCAAMTGVLASRPRAMPKRLDRETINEPRRRGNGDRDQER